ncbi:MAG: response regulator [Cellulosilyticaceae bacterium]
MYRVIVIDDERYIRSGIVSLIDWRALECDVIAECANGLEGLEYIKNNQVDIIVCDIKMPGMDGLKLSEYVKEYSTQSKMIILTAYQEFEYAQKAIKNGVVDFIIKTDFMEELPKSIQKVIKIIEEERKVKVHINQLKEKIHNNQEDLKDKVIMDLLKGSWVDIKNTNWLIEEGGIHTKSYYIITMELGNEKIEVTKTREDKNKPDPKNGFFNTIKNFVTMVFKEYDYTILPMENNLIATIIYMKENQKENIKSLIVLCNEILFVIEEFMRFSVKIGISNRHDKIDDFNLAYIEALSALGKLFENHNSIGIYDSEKDSGEQEVRLDVEVYIQKIEDSIKQCLEDEARKELKQFIKEIANSNVSFEQAKTYLLMIALGCLRITANYDILQEEYNLKEINLYQQINQSKSLDTLYQIADAHLTHVIGIAKKQGGRLNNIVREINYYIAQNYNKNLTLNMIASHLHVSSSYLSKVYKKETGESVIEALNKYRIEVAKGMLKQPDIKIFEVGEAVGIEDPAYFTHVFTKFVGVSPKEFKTRY